MFHEHSKKGSEFTCNNLPIVGVIELKGNPLPKIAHTSMRHSNNPNNLANILLWEAKKEYEEQKNKDNKDV